MKKDRAKLVLPFFKKKHTDINIYREMKKTNVVIGLLSLIGIIFIIIISANSDDFDFQINAKEFLTESKELSKNMSPIDAAESILEKKSNVVFVDVRNEDMFNTFHLENAVNIPIHKILNEESIEFYKSDVKKVFYCNNGILANQVWMLLTQFGIKNIFVLQGGLDYFSNNIIKKYSPKGTAYNDEILLYDYSKMMQTSGSQESSSSSSKISVSVKSEGKNKNSVQGGCS